MTVVLEHKGRPITEEDIAAIRALMSERATWTRRWLPWNYAAALARGDTQHPRAA